MSSTATGRVTTGEQVVCEVAARRVLNDPYPQIRRYRATFGLGLAATTPGTTDADVGGAEFVVLPSWDEQTFDALDDQSWDLAVLGRLLRNGYYDILVELRGRDPRDGPAGTWPAGPASGAGVVLVEQVWVDQPWRGYHIGLIGTGLALRELRRGAAFALLYPMQPGLGTEAARAVSNSHLSRYWSRLGFTHQYEGHLVLDLATEALDTCLRELAREFTG